jgi:hypothetical protein
MMLELLFVWIWLGGVFADENEKRGFWNRVLWPIDLGEWLYYRVIKVNKG